MSKLDTTGIITDLNIDFNSSKPKITLLLDTKNKEVVEELKNDGKLNIELKKYSKKRSLDCNAYMWVLIQEIAEKLSTQDISITKEEIYRDAIKTVGAYTIVPIKTEAVDEWIRIWQSNGIGWVCDTQPSKLEGFTNVMCYHGSSVYTQVEMNRLVNVIVENCRNLGIETKSKQEIDSLLKEWR